MYFTSNFFTILISQRMAFTVVIDKPMTARDVTMVIFKAMDTAELVLFNEVRPKLSTEVEALSIPSHELVQNGFKVTAIDWKKLSATDRYNYEQILEKCAK